MACQGNYDKCMKYSDYEILFCVCVALFSPHVKRCFWLFDGVSTLLLVACVVHVKESSFRANLFRQAREQIWIIINLSRKNC